VCVCVRVCLSMTQLVREVEALVRYVYGVGRREKRRPAPLFGALFGAS
jgi:hypothetical protein